MTNEAQAAQGENEEPYFLYGDEERRGDALGIVRGGSKASLRPTGQATGDNLFGARGALAGAARRGPWILCGLLLAAAIHALAGPWALQPAPLALAAAGAVLLASALVPHGAGATAATLVSGVLVLKGAPAPLLLAALAVGSAIDRAALRSRRSLVLLVTVSPAAAAAAVLLHVRATAPASVRWPFGDLLTQLSMRAQPAAAPALLAVLALLAVVVFRSGLRGFLSPLRHGAHREAQR